MFGSTAEVLTRAKDEEASRVYGGVTHLKKDAWYQVLAESFTKQTEVVDWFEYPSTQLERGQKTGGRGTYVISTVSESSKYSDGYSYCTGLYVFGVDRVTGKTISMLTHQNPVKVLNGLEDMFISDLTGSLTEFAARVDPESIRTGYLGGKLHPEVSDITVNLYSRMYALINKIVSAQLGKSVGIVSHPTSELEDQTCVYLDSDTGHTFITTDVPLDPSVQVDKKVFLDPNSDLPQK
jgi:hypothetical protein